MPTLKEIAEKNVREHLVDNPCRGIVVGLGENGKQMQVSWIMGRSENSQNRVYTVKDGRLKTEAADPSKVKDPSLIIYNVMSASVDDAYVVSNGDQTDSVFTRLQNTNVPLTLKRFFDGLSERSCEPDAPNFTPRITGYQNSYMANLVALSVLKADPFAREQWIETAKASGLTKEHFKREDRTPEQINEDYNFAIDHLSGLNHTEFPTMRDRFLRAVEPGFGYMVTTYMPGSKELPSFKGEPLLVPMRGSLEEVMQSFWSALEPNFRVAVGGREISPGEVAYATPINRFTKKE